MENQHGYLIRCDEQQYQRTFEEPSFDVLLNELSVNNKTGLKDSLSGILLSSSSNRSNFYFNYMFKEFAPIRKNMEYRVPVYGVKGLHKMARAMLYSAFYLSKKDEMLSPEFFTHIFGTDYIREEEARTLPDPVKRLGRGTGENVFALKQSSRLLVCRIVERLWSALEQDPNVRFILLLQDAEGRSLELLRQIYLLIPARLRLSLGFLTNAKETDLTELIARNQLPIHIITMEREEYGTGQLDCQFPTVYFDLEQQDTYSYNENRLRSLEQLFTLSRPLSDLCWAYAEKKVLEATDDIPSFRHYQEILDKFFSGDLYWWRKKGLTTVEQIQEAYTDQESLMDVDTLRREALYTFYTEIMQRGDLAEQMISIQRDPSCQNRDSLLNFVKEKLFYGKELEAIERLIRDLAAEKEQELSALEQKTAQRERTSLEQQKLRLTEEKTQELQKLRTEHEERQRSLQSELMQFKKEWESASKQLKAAQATVEDLSRQMQVREQQFKKELQERDRELNDNSKTLAKAQTEINKLKNESDKKLKEKNKKLETKLSGVGTMRTVFGILMGVFAAVAIACGVLLIVTSTSRSTLQKENASLESELEKEKSLREELEAAAQDADETENQSAEQTDETTAAGANGTGTKAGNAADAGTNDMQQSQSKNGAGTVSGSTDSTGTAAGSAESKDNETANTRDTLAGAESLEASTERETSQTEASKTAAVISPAY